MLETGPASSGCGGMPLTKPAGGYRARHPERTVVYGLFEEHFERYLREYGEPGSGDEPLTPML